LIESYRWRVPARPDWHAPPNPRARERQPFCGPRNGRRNISITWWRFV